MARPIDYSKWKDIEVRIILIIASKNFGVIDTLFIISQNVWLVNVLFHLIVEDLLISFAI